MRWRRETAWLSLCVCDGLCLPSDRDDDEESGKEGKKVPGIFRVVGGGGGVFSYLCRKIVRLGVYSGYAQSARCRVSWGCDKLLWDILRYGVGLLDDVSIV